MADSREAAAEAERVEIDAVLPPESGRRKTRAGTAPVSALLARLLDNWIQIPGTRFRVGLDPIIGLFPAVGDALAGILGAVIIGEADRLGVRKWVQLRMAGNIFLNALIGVIPGFGDAFSVWFKSNARNYGLLLKHLPEPARAMGSSVPPPKAQKRRGIFGIVLMIVVVAAVVATVTAMVAALAALI